MEKVETSISLVPLAIDDSMNDVIYQPCPTPVERESTKGKSLFSKWCQHGCRFWCKKYFWEGQLTKVEEMTNEEFGRYDSICQRDLSPGKRKLLAVIVPAMICHIAWYSVMVKHHHWHVFATNYPTSIVMVFASLLAGMTSKGCGALVFPVMTLTLGISPTITRDFLMITQSIGLSCASFSIIFMKVHTEKHALIWCLIGGAFGVILGLECIDPLLSESLKKMAYVSISFSFTFALILLNKQTNRRTFINIAYMNWWKAIVLLMTGIIGGIINAFAGSGIEICCFCVLTLMFRVSEKVATSTSVLLMAFSSMIGSFWRTIIMKDMSDKAWDLLLVSVPIVVFGAPIGSVIASHFHRLVLACIIYILDISALVAAFVIVPQTTTLALSSVAIIVTASLLFFVVTKIGQFLLNQYNITYINKCVQTDKIST